ncbi:MAG: threonine synthase [Alphaproteobacteria bacterium]
MQYLSTRGIAPNLGFKDVVLAGLATDGGLYVPQIWPRLSPDAIAQMKGMGWAELAAEVTYSFAGGGIDRADWNRLFEETAASFDEPDVTPLKHLGGDLHLLELFHGPTLAFKDVALQFLGRLFDQILGEQDKRLTVIGATSGDTGSAAIHGLKGRERADCFILYPHGRVSEVQRRQMTTEAGGNVHCLAIEGSFDDCQDIVKALFGDLEFRQQASLSAVNSINWARIMAQITYYFYAALQLGAPETKISFAVPTGNFGNVYAAWCARAMGLPIKRLIIGSNANDILSRFITSGKMELAGVSPTLSPSMDIQVSSNFERLLFEVEARHGRAVGEIMQSFRETGSFALPEADMARLRALFEGHACSDEDTLATIRAIKHETGEVLDPHTAVGVFAARQSDVDGPVVALACAHPAKFPDAVEQAVETCPALPARLANLHDLPEKFDVLPADAEAVKAYIGKHARALSAPAAPEGFDA